jgi:hypothetical protein
METKTETERSRISCVGSCTSEGRLTSISHTLIAGRFQGLSEEHFS